jgi:hypothetical protein
LIDGSGKPLYGSFRGTVTRSSFPVAHAERQSDGVLITLARDHMANVDEELRGFVREVLARAVPRAEVKRVLLEAGWPSEQVLAALGSFADLEFPVPVPKPRPYLSARETFLYLILFTALCLAAFNLGSLLCKMIDRAFPDPALTGRSAEWALSGMRWDVSWIIVSFPLFLWMSHLVSRWVHEAPVKRASSIRKWLTYMTLFIAAGVLIGDLATFVYNLLGGDLTVRFVLKVLTVGTIGGTVFGYYLWDLRAEEKSE